METKDYGEPGLACTVVRQGWAGDRQVGRVTDRALAKPGMTVIPVLVDDAALPATADLPEDIRALTECQVRRMSDVAAYREIDVRALAEDIERAGGMTRLAARTQASPAAVTNLEPAFRYLPFARDEVAARAAFKAWTQGLLMVPKGSPSRPRCSRSAPAGCLTGARARQ